MPIYIANVAAIVVKFANRIRSPFTAPTTKAPTNINRNPTAMVEADLSSLTKNEAMTTRKPASGPTERSIPATRSATVWPSAMKPSAVAARRMLATLNEDKKFVF